MVTDSGGNVTQRYDYLPSGEEIPQGLGGRTSGLLYQLDSNNASTETTGQYGDGFNPKFVGQIRDPESGLDYMNARYYSPAQGRFISPDPANAGADPTNPQTWNGYAYVGNNPTSVSDPDGLGFWSSFGNFFLNLGLDFLTGGLNAILGASISVRPPAALEGAVVRWGIVELWGVVRGARERAGGCAGSGEIHHGLQLAVPLLHDNGGRRIVWVCYGRCVGRFLERFAGDGCGAYELARDGWPISK